MFCPNCGAKLPDTAKFCLQCGTSLTSGSSADIANLMELGQTSLRANLWKEADQHFSKVLERNPDLVQAWVGKALSLAHSPSLEELVRVGVGPGSNSSWMSILEKGLSIDPDNSEILMALARRSSSLEVLERVARRGEPYRSAAAQAVIDLARIPPTEVERRSLDFERRHQERQLRLYDIALEFDPSQNQVIAADLIQAVRSPFGGGMEFYNRALEIDPSCADRIARYLIEWAFRMTGGVRTHLLWGNYEQFKLSQEDLNLIERAKEISSLARNVRTSEISGWRFSVELAGRGDNYGWYPKGESSHVRLKRYLDEVFKTS